MLGWELCIWLSSLGWALRLTTYLELLSFLFIKAKFMNVKQIKIYVYLWIN